MGPAGSTLSSPHKIQNLTGVVGSKSEHTASEDSVEVEADASLFHFLLDTEENICTAGAFFPCESFGPLRVNGESIFYLELGIRFENCSQTIWIWSSSSSTPNLSRWKCDKKKNGKIYVNGRNLRKKLLFLHWNTKYNKKNLIF